MEYSLQENFLGGYCVIFFGNNVYFYILYSTFVLHTLMCLKFIGRPFTVENSPGKKRDILLGPCLDNKTAG